MEATLEIYIKWGETLTNASLLPCHISCRSEAGLSWQVHLNLSTLIAFSEALFPVFGSLEEKGGCWNATISILVHGVTREYKFLRKTAYAQSWRGGHLVHQSLSLVDKLQERVRILGIKRWLGMHKLGVVISVTAWRDRGSLRPGSRTFERRHGPQSRWMWLIVSMYLVLDPPLRETRFGQFTEHGLWS